MSNYLKHTVGAVTVHQKLADYLPGIFKELNTKSRVKRAISEEALLINGDVAKFSHSVRKGDVIEFKSSRKPAVKKAAPFDIPIVYKDEHCVIVNKPGGIAVNGIRDKSVENYIKRSVGRSTEKDALDYPVPVHRLDVPTSGLVMLSRTRTFQVQMGKMLQSRKVKKVYHAIVHGAVKEEGVVSKPLDYKPSITIYEPIKVVPSQNFGFISLLALQPVTGRTHQLRKHMQMIGHPIAGDKLYGDLKFKLESKGLMLCAVQLSFQHPCKSEKVDIKIDMPSKFQRLLDREELFYKKQKDSSSPEKRKSQTQKKRRPK
jgi:RluA family pseudouridine synthase